MSEEPAHIQKARKTLAELNDSSHECFMAMTVIDDYNKDRELTAARDRCAALEAEVARLKTPPSAMRDCTIDELIENLGKGHLAAVQIASLRVMVQRQHKLSPQDLRCHGSVALMKENENLRACHAELMSALENAIERLEASQPEAGSATDRVLRMGRKALKSAARTDSTATP